jgi:hypothetical protein
MTSIAVLDQRGQLLRLAVVCSLRTFNGIV